MHAHNIPGAARQGFDSSGYIFLVPLSPNWWNTKAHVTSAFLPHNSEGNIKNYNVIGKIIVIAKDVMSVKARIGEISFCLELN